jgi:ketosteroid isomerase-like protein
VPTDSRSLAAGAVLGAGLAAGLPALNRLAARRLLERDLRALRAGDPGPLLSSYAEDATLVFPGDHSWGGTYRGREAIRGFLERFLAAGLQGEPGEIAVVGPPWRCTLWLQFNDLARGPDGAVVYENRAVLVARLRWGRIVAEEVYEDTQKVVAFDRHLAAHAAPVAA